MSLVALQEGKSNLLKSLVKVFSLSQQKFNRQLKAEAVKIFGPGKYGKERDRAGIAQGWAWVEGAGLVPLQNSPTARGAKERSS